MKQSFNKLAVHGLSPLGITYTATVAVIYGCLLMLFVNIVNQRILILLVKQAFIRRYCFLKNWLCA